MRGGMQTGGVQQVHSKQSIGLAGNLVEQRAAAM